MPIYAYRCESCGFTRDVLQKLSDAPLTECSSCGQPTFKKQLTAAGFQLKGTGWYVTDFRDGGNKASASTPSDTASSSADSGSSSAPATTTTASSTASPGGTSSSTTPTT